jgi:hypothetical protein
MCLLHFKFVNQGLIECNSAEVTEFYIGTILLNCIYRTGYQWYLGSNFFALKKSGRFNQLGMRPGTGTFLGIQSVRVTASPTLAAGTSPGVGVTGASLTATGQLARCRAGRATTATTLGGVFQGVLVLNSIQEKKVF